MPPKKKSPGRPSIVERQRRVPIGGHKMKLEVPKELVPPGYEPRWVNDTPGRLHRFTQAGYEFAQKDKIPNVGDPDISRGEGIDSRVRSVVGTTTTGEPLYAYLMLQKKKWYDEDQVAKEEHNLELEDAIRRGEDERGRPGDGQRYVPKNVPISIKHGK